MPWFAFDITQGCRHTEGFTFWLDLAGLDYVEVSRDTFDQVKKRYRRRWCRMCTTRRDAAHKKSRRTTTRRNVRTTRRDAAHKKSRRTTTRRNVRTGDTGG